MLKAYEKFIENKHFFVQQKNLRLEAKKPYNFDRNPKRGALSKKGTPGE